MATIIKRNGQKEEFNKEKIRIAILKAMKLGSGRINEEIAHNIALYCEKLVEGLEDKVTTINFIEEVVYDELIKHKHKDTARYYEGYRAVQAFKRQTNTTDEGILGLLRGTNEEVIKENSNKNAHIAPTQRDLVAGEVSKDIARRKLLPAHIVQAHDEGILHYHDMDYAAQSIFNCCLIDIKDMLENGTVINGKLVESPKSFQVACTVLTQIIAQIASGQYGGQSVNIKHLGLFLRRSKERYINQLKGILSADTLDKVVSELVKKELEAGVQTIQYQINTLQTSNGI